MIFIINNHKKFNQINMLEVPMKKYTPMKPQKSSYLVNFKCLKYEISHKKIQIISKAPEL